VSGNQVSVYEPQCGEITISLAKQYGMEPERFEQTVLLTCTDGNVTREEFAAFLMVAREHGLNPILRQIYAFPKKGGGIVPIVSIDGWMHILNSHPKFDGMDFEEKNDGASGELLSTTCTIYRKDRAHPIRVTEYYDECKRGTEPWKMKHRMLRHKAAIQCARYAFGFAGIYDEDEGRVIAETPAVRQLIPPEPDAVDDSAVIVVRETKAPEPRTEQPYAEMTAEQGGKIGGRDYVAILENLDKQFRAATTHDLLRTIAAEAREDWYLNAPPEEIEKATALYRRHVARVREAEPPEPPEPDDDQDEDDDMSERQLPNEAPSAHSTDDDPPEPDDDNSAAELPNSAAELSIDWFQEGRKAKDAKIYYNKAPAELKEPGREEDLASWQKGWDQRHREGKAK
jgi:phage recombination protein Bet